MIPARTIVVRFTAEGWHYWPEAEGERACTASRTATCSMSRYRWQWSTTTARSSSRSATAYARLEFGRGDGPASCEALAERLLKRLTSGYGGRCIESRCL